MKLQMFYGSQIGESQLLIQKWLDENKDKQIKFINQSECIDPGDEHNDSQWAISVSIYYTDKEPEARWVRMNIDGELVNGIFHQFDRDGFGIIEFEDGHVGKISIKDFQFKERV